MGDLAGAWLRSAFKVEKVMDMIQWIFRSQKVTLAESEVVDHADA